MIYRDPFDDVPERTDDDVWPCCNCGTWVCKRREPFCHACLIKPRAPRPNEGTKP